MVVINTSPVLSLLAAFEKDLSILEHLFGKVVVPQEVFCELAGGAHKDSAAECLQKFAFIEIRPKPIHLPNFLQASLDVGEGAVIQTALGENISTVVIDERKARRVARLAGLKVTGTIGVLLLAKE